MTTHGADPSGPRAFPTGGLARFAVRTPRYARLAWNLACDSGVPATRRAIVMAAATYLVSPIDALPGFIPVIGQLDDLVVIVAGIYLALAGLDPDARRAHLERAGMSDVDYDADMATLREAGVWAGDRATALAADLSSAAGRRAAAALGGLVRGVRERVGGRTTG